MSRFALTALLVVGTACGRDDQGAAVDVQTWSVAPQPDVIIGQEGREGHELFRVLEATRLNDGRIAVVNAGTSEIRFFSPVGEYLGFAGGEGRGPAEFPRISSAARVAGDSILVQTWDPAIAVVSPAMEVVRKTPMDVSPLRIPCRIAESGVGLTRSGIFVIQAEDNLGNPGCPPNPGGVRQNTDLLATYDPVAERFDTLGIFPSTDRDGPRYGAFGRMLAVAASAGRVFAGETGGDTISVYSTSGEHLATWRHPLPAIPLTDAARSFAPEPRRFEDGRVETPEPYTMPATYPRFGRLVADLAGNLWIMAYPALDEPISSWRLKMASYHVVEDGGARWTVLDSTGVPVAEVRTPPSLYPLEIGDDYVLGLALDELDVETVRLHRLSK